MGLEEESTSCRWAEQSIEEGFQSPTLSKAKIAAPEGGYASQKAVTRLKLEALSAVPAYKVCAAPEGKAVTRLKIEAPSALPAYKVCGLSPVKKPSLLERRRTKSPVPMLSIEKGEDLAVNKSPAIEEKYNILELLGSGTTSTVHRALRLYDQNHVALKVMRSRDPEYANTARAEFEMLKRLTHVNIIRVFDFDVLDGQSMIVMECFDGKPLDLAVRASPMHRLPETYARGLGVQLLRAVGYLHARDIVHRDIKPQNMIASKNLQEIRLVDFNTACNVEKDALTPAGTALYNAPEVLDGNASTKSSDVWSCGLVVYFMISGRLPQRRSEEGNVSREGLTKQGKTPVSFSRSCWEKVSLACSELLADCMEIEAAKRPCMADVLLVPWVSEVPEIGAEAGSSWCGWIASLFVDSDLNCCVSNRDAAVQSEEVLKKVITTQVQEQAQSE